MKRKTRNAKVLAKHLFGPKYESGAKSLLTSLILFAALGTADLKLSIAPFILYLTSAVFTGAVMWQMLSGKRHMDVVEGMLLLPFENRNFIFSYMIVLGMYTLITKTLPVWALFLALHSWSGAELAAAFSCGCMACAAVPAWYLLLKSRNPGNRALAAGWLGIVLAVILAIRHTGAVLFLSLVSMAGSGLYLNFADGYDFYHSAWGKEGSGLRMRGLYQKRRGCGSASPSMILYLIRYLAANKSSCINTLGLWAFACFLPLLFEHISSQGFRLLPFGFAILCMNTPISTLLSTDPELEQALRVLPGQGKRFCGDYGLFLFGVNMAVFAIYLCSWQLVCGGLRPGDGAEAALWALLSAALSVLLEWKFPIRGWKTESDLWHHPRKYLVPLIMMAAVFGRGEIGGW